MQLAYGNRCGHRALSPILQPTRPIPTGPGGYPRILSIAAERVEGFYGRPSLLPSIAIGPGDDEVRSERREAIVRVLKGLLKFCDLASLRVGTVSKGAFVNIHFQTIADHADLELRRAERAIAQLQEGGFLTVIEQRIHTAMGTVRSVPAIKRLSLKLFHALNLPVALAHERAKAKKRSAVKEPTPPPRPELRDAVANMGRQIAEAQRKRAAAPPDPDPGETDRRRRWSELALKLRADHPDWPQERIRTAADAAMA